MKIFICLIMFIVSTPIFSEEKIIDLKLANLYADLEKKIIENKEDPELLSISQLEEDKIFEIDKYKDLSIEKIQNIAKHIFGIYIIYSNYIPKYENEFTHLLLFMLDFSELLVNIAIENDTSEVNMDKTTMIQGFSQAIESSCYIFSATGVFRVENRISIALLTKEKILRKLEIIPISRKTNIYMLFAKMRENETVEKIKNIENEIMIALNITNELAENLNKYNTEENE